MKFVLDVLTLILLFIVSILIPPHNEAKLCTGKAHNFVSACSWIQKLILKEQQKSTGSVLVADSAYNSQNTQFGLVIQVKLFISYKVCANQMTIYLQLVFSCEMCFLLFRQDTIRLVARYKTGPFQRNFFLRNEFISDSLDCRIQE